jgi:2-haloacid dehalogenase
VSYEWILFDADGTLFDYDRAEANALQRTFEEMGQRFEPGFVDAYRRVNGQIWLDFERGRISQERLRTRRFELLFEDTGLDLSPETFSPRYLQNLAHCTDLIDGAEEVVRALYGRTSLMLITNGLQEVQWPRFVGSALRGYFDGLVISEEVGVAKPAPGIFDVAFKAMGHPDRAAVLMVGDSLTSDMRGGIDYGIDTCWFNPGRQPRDPELEIRYEIHDLRQLLGLVEVHGAFSR